MSKPNYTVVVTMDGTYTIKKLKEVQCLKPKGTSLIKSQRLLKELQND